MNAPSIHIETALQHHDAICLDARSEGEFEHAHIPGARSLPLLNNEDRHAIGILYKKEGKQAAVKLGFERVGPRFHQIIEEGLRIAGNREVIVYCWRGGMRSNILGWLLQTAGLRVRVVEGGYKSYRTHAIQLFERSQRMCVLHGKTGSGKTEWLLRILEAGQQVIDLEGIAHHKGSSFGALGQLPQPTQEQFENNLAMALRAIDPQCICWVEGESRMIGRLRIPDPFFDQMQNCPLIELEVPMEKRIARIVREYGLFPKEQLEERTRALTKRMGGDRVKESVEGLLEGNWERWLAPLLAYYDKTYLYALENAKTRKIGVVVDDGTASIEHVLNQLIETSRHELNG